MPRRRVDYTRHGAPAYAGSSDHYSRARVAFTTLGVPCLTPVLRNAQLPKDFKGPRKVPNYTADLHPQSWVESYEMAMEMLDMNGAACAKYFCMMLEGTTHTWLESLPPNSIRSWDELKSRFIGNFKDTC